MPYDPALLGKSLFYYCAGKDPSPILALEAEAPLYVYVDLLKSPHTTFACITEELYTRLAAGGLRMVNKQREATVGSLAPAKAAELTVWQTQDGRSFTLLYLEADATEAYRALYGSELLPRYVCNYRYEMDASYLIRIEQRIPYVLGHCHSKDFAPIAEFPYRGDYSFGKETTVILYKNGKDYVT